MTGAARAFVPAALAAKPCAILDFRNLFFCRDNDAPNHGRQKYAGQDHNSNPSKNATG